MQFRKEGKNYIVRLERNDEVITELTKLAEEQNIKGAYFTGIGAASKVKLGCYDIDTKEYSSREFCDKFEITSLTGNITTLGNGDAAIHAHITVANKDFQVVGGHLLQCHISLTCEIFITVLENEIKKVPDNELGINIMKL